MIRNSICLLILTLLITVTIPASDVASWSNYDNYESSTKILVRIQTDDTNINNSLGVEIIAYSTEGYIDVMMPRNNLAELEGIYRDYSVLIWDVDAHSQAVKDAYHSLTEMENMLVSISNTYPNITDLYSIGKSHEGRDIWCLEITDKPGIDEGEPGVFFMGLHHAREWPTVEICLYIADKLTSNYGSDQNITNLVNNRRLWLVTCVNPDGYYYGHDLGHDWRKNRHYFPEYGTYGVDLNRNYGGSSNGIALGMWGSTGMSHNSKSELYCGQGIFSELETQAIRNVFLENDICASISWHTHGELVMWPWGYSLDEITHDDAHMSQIGEEIASRITSQDGTRTYTPTQSCGLYPTAGDTTDWAYGYSHYVQGRPTFAYTIEACNSFHPDADVLDQVCAENFEGAIYLLQEAENIKATIPRVIPPKIDEMTSDDDGEYKISWNEVNSDANPEHFQLDELTNLSLIIDDAEFDSSAWNLEDFSLSASRYHSSSYSYKSHRVDNKVSSMTSVYPITVTDDLLLSFWCWYNIENNYDMAFVEVSKDGRYYDILDKFTGSSGDWTYKSYILDKYAGDSVFIRFRYSTDSNTHGEGFYVDDILPVADFGNINTLSSSIKGSIYEITGNSEGIYYYRVRGYNSEHGWGDFSTLKKINVAFDNNTPPNTPILYGQTNGKAGEEYRYEFLTIDPDDDDVYYYIEWGDGEFEEWLGPYDSDEKIKVNHSWDEKGGYIIRAKVKDEHGAESYWGVLQISMPKSKRTFNPFAVEIMKKLIEFFPLFERIMQLPFFD